MKWIKQSCDVGGWFRNGNQNAQRSFHPRSRVIDLPVAGHLRDDGAQKEISFLETLPIVNQ